MAKDAVALDVRVLDLLLGGLVDTREKLDVVVCLQHARGALTTVAIAAREGSWRLDRRVDLELAN